MCKYAGFPAMKELEEKYMKFKKLVAAAAAAAVAVSMTAFNAFAATVAMNSEYPGAWAQSAYIPKAEFEAIGGDVKVVMTVEVKEPMAGEHNHVAKPFDVSVSWDQITDSLLSDTVIAKEDGFFIFADGQTTCEFVVPESVWSAWGDDGLSFQVNDVILKSADLSAADSTPGPITRVPETEALSVMDGTYAGAAASTADDAPAADTGATTAATTGNAPVAAMAAVLFVAGVAAVAAKKRK